MSASALCGRGGALVSVSISVNARQLELLLEALAQLTFPINPQIYHDAALIYHFPDNHEETEATTLVDFPAYEAQLDEVRGALTAFGFDSESLQVTGMMEDIHAEHPVEAAPAGASYVSRYRVKRRVAVAQG